MSNHKVMSHKDRMSHKGWAMTALGSAVYGLAWATIVNPMLGLIAFPLAFAYLVAVKTS